MDHSSLGKHIIKIEINIKFYDVSEQTTWVKMLKKRVKNVRNSQMHRKSPIMMISAQQIVNSLTMTVVSHYIQMTFSCCQARVKSHFWRGKIMQFYFFDSCTFFNTCLNCSQINSTSSLLMLYQSTSGNFFPIHFHSSKLYDVVWWNFNEQRKHFVCMIDLSFSSSD